YLALDDRAFLQIAAGEGLVQHCSEIVTGRIIRSSSRSHLFSNAGYCRQLGLRGVSRAWCQGSANPDDRSLRGAQQRAGSMPARSIRMIYPEPETSVSTSRPSSGLS